jgi:hypothetical protein
MSPLFEKMRAIWSPVASRQVCLFCLEDLEPGHFCLAAKLFLLQFKLWLTTDDGRAFAAQITKYRPGAPE